MHPDRTVVSVNGDGCYMMHGQELATAVQYGANTIFLVVNNGMFGTIRMHQEREYPNRISATELHNPDFAALAKAYGAHGEVVTKTAEFEGAFERAQASGCMTVIGSRWPKDDSPLPFVRRTGLTEKSQRMTGEASGG